MPKFQVSRTNEEEKGDLDIPMVGIEMQNQNDNAVITQAGAEDPSSENRPSASQNGAEKDGEAQADNAQNLQTQVSCEETHKNLYLYQEDMKHMPRVATYLKNVLSYHTVYPTEKDAKAAKKLPKKAKLGTILGVYLPTIQHIFGVLMFVRLAWIVGCSGTLESFFMVLMCCLTTFLTAISMSAIATNGMVQAGGSYFMISRNLGPECGGAIGICFYLANTFATDLYLLGSIEILLQYMAPELAFFGDVHKDPFNNYRVYGTVAVLLLTIVVAVGVKFVQMFAPFSLACVIISILCMYIGSFLVTEANSDWICVLGERLMILPHNMSAFSGNTSWCSKDETGDLWHRYCYHDNKTKSFTCDPEFDSSDVRWIPGIPGIASGVLNRNLFPNHLQAGEVEPGVAGDHHKGEVISDMTTSFIALCAIYFPSVTGIMTGSNMSGDLRDPQKSIPVGTIMAQLTCSFVYLSFVLLFGATSEGYLLRDKFGMSVGGSLLASKIAWPSHWVVLVGAFCSTLGAALQCLTSAPRLLQAIARDDIIPFLNVFKVTTKKGEPIRALILTALIAEAGILIASLDYVAHVIDVFFLMCYGFVNATCALQTLLKTPHWRPRFKYYHWSLSLLGVALNLALSIVAGWYYSLAAFVIAGFIYKYVEYKGGEKEWGDGISGLSMAAAQKALLQLDERDPHTKNWRPQLLVLSKPNKDNQPKYPSLFSLATQLKAGKGFTVAATVLEGDYSDLKEDGVKAKAAVKEVMKTEKLKGFAKVMITKDVTVGLDIFIQTVGLGGLRHNTVVVGWPHDWRHSHEERHWKVFIDTIRVVKSRELALLVPRGIENFPHNKQKLSDTIDVWWIVHDGGMLILMAFLLKQHKVWKQCKLRIFTVAQMTDNSIQLKKDLQMFLYQLRINAEVFVEEMCDGDISAYTVERTLDMEKRSHMLKQMHLQRRGTIQEIVDASHTRSGVQSPVRSPTSRSPELSENLDPSDTGFESNQGEPEEESQFTFSATEAQMKLLPGKLNQEEESQSDPPHESVLRVPNHGLSQGRLKRMHTAVKLNDAIRSKSSIADLVIVNFPAPPAKLAAEENYMEYLEALTEGLERVLMVRGSGKEVVTIYS